MTVNLDHIYNSTWEPNGFDKENDCPVCGKWLAEGTVESFVNMVNSTNIYPDVPQRNERDLWAGFYTRTDSYKIISEIADFVFTNCTDAYCQALEWQGNPDIAGTGMMVTYYLEATLACVYAAVLYLRPYLKRRKSNRWHRGLGAVTRLTNAIAESATELLSSMILFSIAMLVATLQPYVEILLADPKTRADKWNSLTHHDAVSSAILAVFSILPPALIQSRMGSLRRAWLRISVWAVIGVLALILEVLSRVTPELNTSWETQEDIPKQDLRNLDWEWYCAPLTTSLQHMLRSFEITAPIVSVAWLALKIPRLGRIPKAPLYRLIWGNLVAVLSFVGMWIYLGFFTAYRSQQASMSQSSNKELEWGFGQVLALATWAPVFVDVAYIFFFGPEEGLEGRISVRFKIVRSFKGRLSNVELTAVDMPLIERQDHGPEDSHMSHGHDSGETEDLGSPARAEDHV